MFPGSAATWPKRFTLPCIEFMPFNLPILLTWLRIVAIPLLIAVYYLPAAWATPLERDLFATVLFMAAGFTDWADGYLARRWNQTSAFGAFLDPVADKLMVAAALVVLVQLGRLDALIAFIIIGREITISALREWMARLGKSASVAVGFVGKLKTAAQMAAISLLQWGQPVNRLDLLWWGTVLIYLAAVLTLWSMVY